MTFVAPTLNGMAVVKASLTIPWRGRWVCTAELAPTLIALSPTSGPAALVLGGVPLLGTVDALGSSTWVQKGFCRAVAGMGGWDKPATGVQFNSAAGSLLSTQVYASVAQAVGELPPVDSSPVVFGVNDIIMGGQGATSVASAVFGDRDWYIDLPTGIAQVAPWRAATLDSSAVIVDWDGYHQRATLNSDALVLPGTTLSDPRFNGTSYTVRSVEQTFTAEGSTVIAECSPNAVDRAHDALTVFVRQAADTAHLKTYQYRFVLGDGNNLALQGVTPGAPNLNPIAQYSGLSGTLTKFAPSTLINVTFTADVPPQPFIAAVSPLAKPLETTIDASTEASFGPSAATVKVGGSSTTTVDVGGSSSSVAIAGGSGALVLATPYQALLTALTTLATSLGTAASVAQVAAAGTALGTALAALPPPATVQTTAT